MHNLNESLAGAPLKSASTTYQFQSFMPRLRRSCDFLRHVVQKLFSQYVVHLILHVHLHTSKHTPSRDLRTWALITLRVLATCFTKDAMVKCIYQIYKVCLLEKRSVVLTGQLSEHTSVRPRLHAFFKCQQCRAKARTHSHVPSTTGALQEHYSPDAKVSAKQDQIAGKKTILNSFTLQKFKKCWALCVCQWPMNFTADTVCIFKTTASLKITICSTG